MLSTTTLREGGGGTLLQRGKDRLVAALLQASPVGRPPPPTVVPHPAVCRCLWSAALGRRGAEATVPPACAALSCKPSAKQSHPVHPQGKW